MSKVGNAWITVMVIDTHVWLWFLSGSDELAKPLRNRIEQDPQSILLSSISVWEAIMLAERGRIEVEGSPCAHFREALRLVPVSQAAISYEIAIKSREIKLTNADPADRFIAATALVYDVPLATADRRLSKTAGLNVIKAR
jgi:PIN domain nuclease of toxin-antitoxin system